MSVITIPGGPGAVSGASGGKVYAFNNISESGAVQVAAANTSRRRITFHNPGTKDVFVFPAYVQNTGSDVALSPSTSSLGGCIRVYANGGQYTIDGECQGVYKAFVATGDGTTNPLTVIDTNV